MHIADKRGYGLTLTHLSKMLIHGAVSEDDVSRELPTMQGISYGMGIYCLKGSEKLLLKTRRKIMENEMLAKKYETLAAFRDAGICIVYMAVGHEP